MILVMFSSILYHLFVFARNESKASFKETVKSLLKQDGARIL